MRKTTLAATLGLAAVLVSGLGSPSPAEAQTYSGTMLSPPELQAKLVAAVAARLLDPAAARISDLTPSLARNGRGYCGRVSLAAEAPTQPFHVILDENGNAAVLILPENGDPPGLARADATRLLTNFGCIR